MWGVGAGVEEGPRKTNKSLPGVGFDARTVASRYSDKVSLKGMADDIARVEFERVALGREDDGGLQRQQAAGGAVGGEVEVGEPFGRASEESLRRRGASEQQRHHSRHA